MDYIINKNTYYLMYDNGKTVINELSTELIIPGNNLKDILENIAFLIFPLNAFFSVGTAFILMLDASPESFRNAGRKCIKK